MNRGGKWDARIIYKYIKPAELRVSLRDGSGAKSRMLNGHAAGIPAR